MIISLFISTVAVSSSLVYPFSIVSEEVPSLLLIKPQKTLYVDIRTNATIPKTDTLKSDPWNTCCLHTLLIRRIRRAYYRHFLAFVKDAQHGFKKLGKQDVSSLGHARWPHLLIRAGVLQTRFCSSML